MREFVENSLDAAEEIRQPPDVAIRLEAIPAHEIVDLYGERLKKFQRELAAQEATAARKGSVRDDDDDDDEEEEGPGDEDAGDAGGDDADKKKSKSKKGSTSGAAAAEQQFFRVTVRDNGCGMQHDDIPHMLGRVLAGSKYSLKQARGRFGLGAKMALIWASISTGRPLVVYSCHHRQKEITECRLDIDIEKNEPIVLKHVRHANNGSLVGTLGTPFPPGWHGTEITVEIQGVWSVAAGTSFKWKTLRYMRQLAVITPYAGWLVYWLIKK